VKLTNEARRASEGGGSVPSPESLLSSRDSTLARVIASESCRWPMWPSENPIWGLVRIVMAQQISTRVACRLAESLKSAHPDVTDPSPASRSPSPMLRRDSAGFSRDSCQGAARPTMGRSFSRHQRHRPLDAVSIPHHGPPRTRRASPGRRGTGTRYRKRLRKRSQRRAACREVASIPLRGLLVPLAHPRQRTTGLISEAIVVE